MLVQLPLQQTVNINTLNTFRYANDPFAINRKQYPCFCCSLLQVFKFYSCLNMESGNSYL